METGDPPTCMYMYLQMSVLNCGLNSILKPINEKKTITCSNIFFIRVKLANLVGDARGSAAYVNTTTKVNKGEARTRKATQTNISVMVNCRPSWDFFFFSSENLRNKNPFGRKRYARFEIEIETLTIWLLLPWAWWPN